MEVSVVNIHNYVRFPSMSLYDSSIDSIEVPAEALIGKSANSGMESFFGGFIEEYNSRFVDDKNPAKKSLVCRYGEGGLCGL
jgi:hypothetical protein